MKSPHSKLLSPKFALLLAVALAGPLKASTAAYWRFETPGPAGGDVPHTGVGGTFDGQLADSSHNGHMLSAWAEGGSTGETFRSSVPGATVPQNGLSNTLCLQNGGSFPGLFTDLNDSLNDATFLQWTVEAYFYATTITINRAIVGRDGQNVATGVPATSPFTLYASRNGDGKPAIVFVDADGNTHTVTSSVTVTTGKWYHLAAVSDGLALRLYLDSLDGAGPQSVGFTIYPRGNHAMAAGADDNDRWSVFRGMNGNAHVDRFNGYIDEVRISDAALVPAQFLSVINPGTGDLDSDDMADDWETTNFGGIGLQNGNGDPDGDGVINFAEYAFNGDPNSARSSGLRLFSHFDTNGNGRRDLTLSFYVRKGAVFTRLANNSQFGVAGGVVYNIRGSTNLQNFASGVTWVSKNVTPYADYELHTFRLDSSDGQDPPSKGFLQIGVVRDEVN